MPKKYYQLFQLFLIYLLYPAPTVGHPTTSTGTPITDEVSLLLHYRSNAGPGMNYSVILPT